MPGTSPYLDGFFNVILTRNGSLIANTTRLDLSTAFTATLRSDGTVAIDINGGASVNGQNITPATVTTTGDVKIGGKLVIGSDDEAILSAGGITTTGPETKTLLTIPVADNRGCGLSFLIVAVGPAGFAFANARGLALISSGSLTALGFSSIAHSLGLPPNAPLSWSAGVLTMSASGPQDTINNVGSNGAGSPKVRVTVASGNLSAWGGTIAVDISGVVGSGDASINGTNQDATYVDASHFDLLSSAWSSGTYTSGGTVVLHTPPVLDWAVLGTAVVVG